MKPHDAPVEQATTPDDPDAGARGLAYSRARDRYVAALRHLIAATDALNPEHRWEQRALLRHVLERDLDLDLPTAALIQFPGHRRGPNGGGAA